jgi:hypothetical protein
MNTSLLDDFEYRKMIRLEIANLISYKRFYDDHMEWWEMFKNGIKDSSELYSRKKASILSRREKQLRARLKSAEDLLTTHPTSRHLQKSLLEAKRELEGYEKRKLDGMMLRSRSKFILGQETPSRAIKMISQARQKNAQIPSLNHPTSGVSSDPHVMLDAATKFYENLFRAPPSGPDVTAAQQELLSS